MLNRLLMNSLGDASVDDSAVMDSAATEAAETTDVGGTRTGPVMVLMTSAGVLVTVCVAITVVDSVVAGTSVELVRVTSMAVDGGSAEDSATVLPPTSVVEVSVTVEMVDVLVNMVVDVENEVETTVEVVTISEVVVAIGDTVDNVMFGGDVDAAIGAAPIVAHVVS